MPLLIYVNYAPIKQKNNMAKFEFLKIEIKYRYRLLSLFQNHGHCSAP